MSRVEGRLCTNEEEFVIKKENKINGALKRGKSHPKKKRKCCERRGEGGEERRRMLQAMCVSVCFGVAWVRVT